MDLDAAIDGCLMLDKLLNFASLYARLSSVETAILFLREFESPVSKNSPLLLLYAETVGDV